MEGAIEGVAEVKATATVTVTGSSGGGDFERTFAANDAAFIQRSNGNTAYGAQQGAVGAPSSGSLNALKHPYGRSFSNNYVLKIKSATDGGYNRRFLIKFNVDDFDGSWSDVKNASIRLYISRYDSWNGLGGSEQNQVNNTAFIMDVYANEPSWTGTAVTWNNAPLNADVSTHNHVGIGTSGEQIPDYKQLQPVSHKEYINKDIIANGHAIDIDVSDYIRGLGDDVTEVSFLCDIPMSNINGFNKDNSGFDAFSALGAEAAWQDYQDGNLKVPAGVELTGPDSLKPQLIVSDIYEMGVDAIEVDTDLGVAPVLPDTATLRYSNNSTRTLGVTWNAIDPALYNAEGSFQVRGYSSATNMPIVATVNVKADHITGFRALPTIYIFVGSAGNQLGLADSVVADPERGNFIDSLLLTSPSPRARH